MKWIIVALSLALTACMPNYSDGFCVGTIVKASSKGIIWKSFEGELVMSSFRSTTKTRMTEGGSVTTAAVGNTWAFSATDPHIMQQLDEAASTGRLVKLTYRQWLMAPPTQMTGYTIVRVEVLDGTNEPRMMPPSGR